VALPEDLALDEDGAPWWDAMVATTLKAFEAADRARLDALLEPLVKGAVDAHVTELGRLATNLR